ncbi:MAG: imidazole glycerol phosphate synthase subunit HisH [Clostridiales bacterium]|nr:imidazole glycerol phosphate synthase subunit HisH [Clostridiales bacterium]
MSTQKVGIIDYKAGNGPSVLNALVSNNIAAELVSTKEQIKQMSALILPGVGSAGATINSLKELDLIDLLDERVNKEGVPFLGICVGLQILFDHSEEEDTKCLSWIPGKVKKFPVSQVRVPQMGWNKVDFKFDNPVLSGLSDSEYFYFVNSYYVIPENKDVIMGTTEYGNEFCSMVKYKNIMATQFHLEKSGEVGLKLLKNFALQEVVTC